jgi:hypothetical protein
MKYSASLPIAPKAIPAGLDDSMRAIFVKRAVGAKVPPLAKVRNLLGQLVVSNEEEVWVEALPGLAAV